MTYIAMQHRVTRSFATIAALVGVLATGGCKSLDVENLNGVGTEDLVSNPNREAVLAATQGLLSQWRSTSSGHASTLAKYGYEHWQARASEPRTLTNVHRDPQTGGFWGYSGVLNANLVLGSLDKISTGATGLTAGEKAGIRAFAKTVLAVLLEDMIQAHDTFGIVLDDLPEDPKSEIPTIANKAAAWARVLTLLNDAYTDLTAPGTTFAFRTHAGWAGFNTPTTFARVVKALEARYRTYAAIPLACNPSVAGCPAGTYSAADWNAVLTALSLSFISPAAPPAPGPSPVMSFASLLTGPFHVYPGNPDATNGLASADRFSNQRIRTEAQCAVAADCVAAPRTAGDGRAFGTTAKVRTVTAFSLLGMSTDLKFTDFLNPLPTVSIGVNSSLPLIRNEELILLRAEANLNLGNTSAAIADINLIRTNRAGLPQVSDPYVAVAALKQPASLLDELLYEKRYSLWGEIGTVWLDLRRYPSSAATAPAQGRSKLFELPVAVAGWKIFDVFPVPTIECEARGYTTAGCFNGGYAGVTGVAAGIPTP